MKKTIFIIPYFGKFKNYFQLFLNSCAYNEDFDWVIFTDDETEYNYPKNVKKISMTFEELKNKIQSKFEFKINLETPYKLCDYRGAYGYIFEEYIAAYDFWGYCDTDLIFGKISNFIKDEIYLNYDKIFFLGHCTLYKNTSENNKIFMSEYNGAYRYKEIYSNKENFSFDEEYKDSINNIYISKNKKILNCEYEANIYTKSSNFIITRYDFDENKYKLEKNKRAIFIFEKGRLYRYYIKKNILIKEEYMYIHMQSRKMNVNINDLNTKIFKIIPNVFENLEFENITINNFKKIKNKKFNLHYFKLRFYNLKVKIKRRWEKK